MTTLPVVPGIASLNIVCTWSQWALFRAVQTYSKTQLQMYSHPKLNTVKGTFLSLQSLLQFCVGPVDFNPLAFKTYLQGREAALSVSCWARSEKHQVWELIPSVSSKKCLDLGCSHLFEGSGTAELLGCGLSSLSTVLGVFTSATGRRGPGYSDLHAKWTGNRNLFCHAIWKRISEGRTVGEILVSVITMKIWIFTIKLSKRASRSGFCTLKADCICIIGSWS